MRALLLGVMMLAPFAPSVLGAPPPWETWKPRPVKLPNPNGYDTYLKAFALKSEIDKKWEKAWRVRKGLPEEEVPPFAAGGPRPKGTPRWVEPAEPPPPQGKPGEWPRPKVKPPWWSPPPGSPPAPGATPPSPPDPWGAGPADRPLAERVALFEPVLKLVRQALDQDSRIPPPTDFMAYADGMLRHYAEFRELGRLLAMEARARLDAGDALGSANSALDCLEVAQVVATQRTLLSFLVEAAIEAFGQKALAEAIPRLDAAGCRAALARLKRIERRRPPLRDTFHGEERQDRLFLRFWMREAAKEPDGSEMVAYWVAWMEGMYEDELHGYPRLPASSQELLALMKADSWRGIEAYWMAAERQVALPYRSRRSPRPTEPFKVMTYQHLQSLWFRDALALTNLRLKRAQIAARCFLLEQGRLPRSLEELVPAYLEAVPADPFGEGPLKVKPAADGLLIYSLGPDCKDDGGTEIKGGSGRFKGVVQETSQGDIVVRLPLVP